MDDQQVTVPDWVVTEVGRLHLHALALERELAALQRKDEDEREPNQ